MREQEPALASVRAHTGGKGDWLEGGWGGGRKWDWKGQEEVPGQGTEEDEKSKRQRPVLRALQGGASWGRNVLRWQVPSSA